MNNRYVNRWVNPSYELPPVSEIVPPEKDLLEMHYSDDVLIWFKNEHLSEPLLAIAYINYTESEWYFENGPSDVKLGDPRVLAWSFCEPPDFKRAGKYFNL